MSSEFLTWVPRNFFFAAKQKMRAHRSALQIHNQYIETFHIWAFNTPIRFVVSWWSSQPSSAPDPPEVLLSSAKNVLKFTIRSHFYYRKTVLDEKLIDIFIASDADRSEAWLTVESRPWRSLTAYFSKMLPDTISKLSLHLDPGLSIDASNF